MIIDEFARFILNVFIINCCPFVKFISVEFTLTNAYSLFELLDILTVIGTRLSAILISLLFKVLMLNSTEFGRSSNRSLLFLAVVAFLFEIAFI